MGERPDALRAMNDAVLAIATEMSVGPILDKIIEVACQLAGARYGALGVPDGDGGFSQFAVQGISAEEWDKIGKLPRTHGMLGAMLEDSAPFRAPDIKLDPRFGGFPHHHPDMKSFLGVPIMGEDRIVGAFYLTDKMGGSEFTDEDQELIEMLATHAAIAIERARLFERSRELTVIEERNRLARDLHDSASQTLFSVVLTAEAVAKLLERDPEEARRQLAKLQDLAREALQEIRSLVFELRPAELEADGVAATLRKHIEVLQRVHHVDIRFDVEGDRRLKPPDEKELFRIAQEAITNAVKHSQAGRVDVRLDVRDTQVSLEVSDDGRGFDPDSPQVRGRHLGLTSMEERARALGGKLSIDSSPGAGTRVRLEVIRAS